MISSHQQFNTVILAYGNIQLWLSIWKCTSCRCVYGAKTTVCSYVISQCSLTPLSKYYSLISFYDCFSTAPAVIQSFSVNETTARPILLNNITCAGTETRLTDCPHSGVGIHNCSHTHDVAVSCPGAYCYIMPIPSWCISL